MPIGSSLLVVARKMLSVGFSHGPRRSPLAGRLEPNQPAEVPALQLQIAGVLVDEIVGGQRAISELGADVAAEVHRSVEVEVEDLGVGVVVNRRP